MIETMNVIFKYKGWHFEWDSTKEVENIRKHSINFECAAKFFRDGESLLDFDYKHSISEERWVALGLDDKGQLLSVCVTWRETETGQTSYRIISAQKISGKKILGHRKRLRKR